MNQPRRAAEERDKDGLPESVSPHLSGLCDKVGETCPLCEKRGIQGNHKRPVRGSAETVTPENPHAPSPLQDEPRKVIPVASNLHPPYYSSLPPCPCRAGRELGLLAVLCDPCGPLPGSCALVFGSDSLPLLPLLLLGL